MKFLTEIYEPCDKNSTYVMNINSENEVYWWQFIA